MQWNRRQPFISTNNMCRSHQVIIDCMSKVISWQSICLYNNNILIVFWKIYIPLYHIMMFYFFIFPSWRFKTNNIAFSIFYFFCHFFYCIISAFCPNAIISRSNLSIFLLCSYSFHFFCCAKTWISFPLFH